MGVKPSVGDARPHSHCPKKGLCVIYLMGSLITLVIFCRKHRARCAYAAAVLHWSKLERATTCQRKISHLLESCDHDRCIMRTEFESDATSQTKRVHFTRRVHAERLVYGSSITLGLVQSKVLKRKRRYCWTLRWHEESHQCGISQ